MYVCIIFRVRLQLLNDAAAVFEKNDKPKFSLPSKLISLSELQLQRENNHMWPDLQKPTIYIQERHKIIFYISLRLNWNFR